MVERGWGGQRAWLIGLAVWVAWGCSEDEAGATDSARVSVDGETYEEVAVRKKGFVGSLSTLRPSLKVNFGTFVDGQTHSGMKRMTLNNNKSDPSNTHQCMAYDLFAQAGAIAPRCNFARVRVNGVDLGVYSHIESIKKPMLRRHFEDDGGNLYEGQGADFSANRVDLMELKTNEAENDRSDLDAVVAALESDDDALLDTLGEVVDIDAFLTFWAMEVMVGHWDSYSGGSNNYLTYDDPTSGRFFFIPWGTDGAFSQTRPFSGENRDVAVLARGRVANRLYGHPRGRAMYFARVAELFERLWDEGSLLAEVDRIAALTDAPEAAIAGQRAFITDHGTAMRAALDASESASDWIDAPGEDGELRCREEAVRDISGRFDTTWGSLAMPQASPTAELEVDVDGWDAGMLLTASGVDSNDSTTAQVLMLSPRPENRIRAFLVRMPRALFTVGEHPMHGAETNVVWAEINRGVPGDVRIIGFGGGGSITLEEASTEPGGTVRGHFEGRIAPIVSL